jgi:phospholipase/carboxylesterase
VDGFELDPESRAGMPISISHGTYDPVISVDFGREARDRLDEAGLRVAYREDPVAHQIAPGAVAQARAVLEQALP